MISALCTVISALCTMISALCTMISALCTMISALCTMISALCVWVQIWDLHIRFAIVYLLYSKLDLLTKIRIPILYQGEDNWGICPTLISKVQTERCPLISYRQAIATEHLILEFVNTFLTILCIVSTVDTFYPSVKEWWHLFASNHVSVAFSNKHTYTWKIILISERPNWSTR